MMATAKSICGYAIVGGRECGAPTEVECEHKKHLPELHLHVNGEYFDQIAAGTKPEEFRLYNEYWTKRLEGKEFSKVVIKRGYPKRGDTTRTLERPWHGYQVKTITHPHFGADPVKVFAIQVNDGVENGS